MDAGVICNWIAHRLPITRNPNPTFVRGFSRNQDYVSKSKGRRRQGVFDSDANGFNAVAAKTKIRKAVLHVGVFVPTFASMAAVFYQDQENASVFSLLACDLCEPTAARKCSPRSGDAAG